VTTWDAATYDRVADPQEAWAREVLDRSQITREDTVLDAGCGSGRVTRLVLERAGRVVAVDADPDMVAKARAALPPEVEVRRQDLLDLTVDEPVDVVFSNAVFHWIADHERLFARVHAALKPGGRLVAQCGGHGNIAHVLDVVGERPGTWLYATPRTPNGACATRASRTRARGSSPGRRSSPTWRPTSPR